MQTKFSFSILVATLLMLMSSGVSATNPPPIPAPITGTPAFGSYAGGPFDTVNLANLNVHFTIPFFSKAGAGGGFYYALSFDSLIWVPVNGVWTPMANWGWRANTEIAVGYVTYDSGTMRCDDGHDHPDYYNFVYHDSAGNAHPFNTFDDPCDGGLDPALATDGSGYTLVSFSVGRAGVYTRSGGHITAPSVPTLQAGTGTGSIVDPNGNEIQTPDGINFYDSTGAVVLTASGNPPTNTPSCTPAVTFKYKAPNNNWVSITVSYVDYEMQTYFRVSGINEFSHHAECLVDKITLPDNTFYKINYEVTNGLQGKSTGRIASITLPTGGVISYTYNGSSCPNSLNCMMADGSPSYMQRIINGGTWNYSRQLNPAGGGNKQFTQTTVFDPANNETDYNFNGIYNTQLMAYQGSHSSGTILKTTRTCYNAVYSYCDTSTTIHAPIFQEDYNDYMNSTGYGNHLWNDYQYDSYGLMMQETDRDYGNVGAVIRVINNHYSHSSTQCVASYICSSPDYVQITDGGGNQKARINYTYDSHGNTTEVSQWTSWSTPYLNRYYSYNSNGTLKTATDPNGTLTNYYSGGYSCGSAFPNSVSVPGDGGVTLTTSYTYNCTGGVVTSVKDANNETTSTSYTDTYFWRPAKTTDALGHITYYNYYRVNNSGSHVTVPGQAESVLSWTSSQGNATIDLLATADSYGRRWLQQKWNPNSGYWDTAQNYYDASGRVNWTISQPYATSAGPGGALYSHLSIIGYDYDGLGRTTQIFNCDGIDCNGSHTFFTYNANDEEISTGPGQTFGRQLEYDALGRLTSVCELLPSGGGSGCGQNTNPGVNGYRTLYAYDPLGDLMAVNQSGQTRSFTYDGVSRMLSEVNPENGTTSYTYDTDSVGTCSGHSGDEIKRVDAANNVTCYVWDGLHRLTNITYKGGPNKANTTDKEYQYDVSNPDGYITASYPKGRLVESHTSTSLGWAGTELFSYDALGEPTDAWEYTPDAGNWYHTVNSYAPNGVVWGRMGYLGLGTSTPFTNGLAYVVDGEGRLAGLWDHNLSQSIWWGTTYSSAGKPDRVAFYNGDSESFLWDQYVGQMTQWKSTVGSQTQTGNLTWNGNGTLATLAIADTADSGNTQTCTNTYDDLSRLSQNFCSGSPGWSQSFTYDAFGNIKKTGSASFTPSYGSNNHISGSGFSYDGMGNVTNDGSNTYSYDAEGRPVKVNSETLFIDGFNRAVEVQAQAYHEFVYSPDGYKFARMNGQTVEQVFAPLAAGMQAVYGPYTHGASQILFWRHSDWLGSGRMASTPGRTVYFDGAYAPYAENYAGIGTSDRSFTGKNMDTVFGIYDFPMRQYSQTQGRWNVPDPAGTSAVNVTNPQTWNRYEYGGNNPVSNIDPRGLYDCDSDDDELCDGDGDDGGGGGGDDGGCSADFCVTVTAPADNCDYDACVVAPAPPDVPTEDPSLPASIPLVPFPDDSTEYQQFVFYTVALCSHESGHCGPPYENTQSAFAQAATQAIAQDFDQFPTLCTPGVGATAKVGTWGVNYNYDFGEGGEITPSIEPGKLAIEPSGNISLNVGEGVGGTVTGNPANHTITSVGVYAGAESKGVELNVNVHASVTSIGDCK